MVLSSWLPRFQPAPMSATICEAFSWVMLPADAGLARPDAEAAIASTAARKPAPNLLVFDPMGFSLPVVESVFQRDRTDPFRQSSSRWKTRAVAEFDRIRFERVKRGRTSSPD